jgi:hypothetical protein
VSDSTEDFFDNIGGAGAPSIKLSAVNDGVIGVIETQFKTEAKEFGTENIKKDRKTGEPIIQLVVILQTDLRNWERVAKVPLVDKDDKSKGTKDPSEDDGRRAVYIEPWTNLHAAVGKAIVEGTGSKGPLRDGGTLGVKITELRDTGKGNPLKVHVAQYTPPAASGGDFFGESKTQGGSGDASATPATSTPAAEPAKDPWGTTPTEDKPPF